MRIITEIILHCSATKKSQKITTDDIRRWHLKRGFKDIGYHWVIYQDGTIHMGRSEDKIGAHCLNHNEHSIGVCYVGGLDENGKAADTRTPEQRAALLSFLKVLHKKYPRATVHGHNEFANKSCPCFKVQKDEEIMAIFHPDAKGGGR